MTGQEIRTIRMTDLSRQNERLAPELDSAIKGVIRHGNFIQGPEVGKFAEELAQFNSVKHVIPCANGTDALQIALMALDLKPGSEVLMPGFTFAAAAEACIILGLLPVFADVDNDSFNLYAGEIEKYIIPKTKAIIPVHLFGQLCDMETILAIAEKHALYVIEDNAQSIGADFTFSNGRTMRAGSMGHISTVSFFPSKNLGCFGDGGAMMTNDDALASRMKMITNHGQKEKYRHETVGLNSRLDTIQAAILSVKLKYLDSFISERQEVAAAYDKALMNCAQLRIPGRYMKSTHVFHQYTIQVFGKDRNKLKDELQMAGIPSTVHYPLPLNKQPVYKKDIYLPVCEALSSSVLSLPMGTDMDQEQIEYITENILQNIINK